MSAKDLIRSVVNGESVSSIFEADDDSRTIEQGTSATEVADTLRELADIYQSDVMGWLQTETDDEELISFSKDIFSAMTELVTILSTEG